MDALRRIYCSKGIVLFRNALFSANHSVGFVSSRVTRLFFTAAARPNARSIGQLRNLTLSVVAFSTGGLVVYIFPKKICSTVFAVAAPDDASKVRRRAQNNFIADIVEEISPSVVYIEVTSQESFPFPHPVQRNATGFFVRSDGLILTNAHSVQKMSGASRQRIQIRTNDGKTHQAKMLHIDPVLDLAILKIDEKDVPVLELADSDSARTGEWVLAVGAPLTLSNTVTMGVISMKSRKSEELHLNKPIHYIQTDAAINEGNSGGPLITLDGKVIGINCMTVAMATGISFAIPSSYAQSFIDDFEKTQTRRKTAKTGWFGTEQKVSEKKPRSIGITTIPLDVSIAGQLRRTIRDFPSDVTKGLLVHSIIVGSPAHNAGLEPGDVITEVNGKQVHNIEDLFKETATAQRLVLSVRRRSTRIRLSVILEDGENDE